MSFLINRLLDRLQRDEADVDEINERLLLAAAPYMAQTEILISMNRTQVRGVSVFMEYHYDRDPKNHQAKLAQYRRFLENHNSQAIILPKTA